MSSSSLNRHSIPRKVLTSALAVAVSCLALVACGSDNGSPAAEGADVESSIPATTDAGVAAGLLKVMNPNVKPSDVAPEIQSAMMSGEVELTPEQQKIWEQCMSETSCEIGTGKYVMAFIDDQVNAYVSLQRGEAFDYAIKSGQVNKIITMTNQGDVQKTLADFRSAMAQGANLIVGMWASTGNQLGPVFDEAKAAGIPVVNAAVQLSPEVASKQAVQFERDLCAMWQDGATKMTEAVAGKANPTYAMFTGVPGNAYAAQWQPCAQDALDKLGWSQVYEGTTDWSPQGTVEAASGLRASGKNPDAIIYDSSLEDFINAYLDAGEKKLPVMANGGSAYYGQAKAFKKATDTGVELTVLQAPSDIWIARDSVAAELAVLDDGKASADVIKYPMSFSDMTVFMDSVDLSQDDFALMGSLLTPEQAAFSIKH
ncbi:MAG: substrate-binding domain-containing protein [Actinomycetales bacterium]